MVKAVVAVALTRAVWCIHWPADGDSNVKPSASRSAKDARVSSEDNIKKLGFDNQIKDFCKREMGCSDLYSWTIQGADDWHDKPNPNPNWPYTVNGQPTFSNERKFTSPATAHAMETCNNAVGSYDLDCTKDLKWSVTQTSETSATEGLTRGMSITIGLKLPITEDSITSSVQISSEQTQSKSVSHTVELTDHGHVTVPPGGETCLKLEGTVTTGSADWTMQVNLEGDILCRFNNKCQGHYLWYVGLSGFSHTVKGTTSADTASASGIQQCDGSCPGRCSGISQNSSLRVPVV